jgi:acid phosphatase family membrane protein YuiD
MNKAICTALSGIAAAQLLKIPFHFAKTGIWDWSLAVEAGGMPSSHSAGVSSLATYIALKRGPGTIDFALSALFGIIVMYDAMGVRRHVGEIATEVNELDVRLERLVHRQPGMYHEKKEKALKERLGHMPEEVLGGALLGIAIGAASYRLEKALSR